VPVVVEFPLCSGSLSRALAGALFGVTTRPTGNAGISSGPAICIKHIDSKRALKGFTGRRNPDEEDRIPEGSTTGKPEKDYVFHGHFLDLRTLAFALTDRGYTLDGACHAFGVEHGNQTVKRHGIVTKKYIDYNRRDVLATSELAVKLLEEYAKHPIDLQATYPKRELSRSGWRTRVKAGFATSSVCDRNAFALWNC
jgi:hypothetical protein